MIDRIVKQFGGVDGFLRSLAEDERHLAFWNPVVRLLLITRALPVNKVAMYEGCRILQRESDATLIMGSFEEMEWSVYETEILNGYYYVRGGRELKEVKPNPKLYSEAIRKAQDYEERYELEKMQSEELSKSLERVNQSAEEQLEEALERIRELEEENERLLIDYSAQGNVLTTYKALLAEKEASKPLSGLQLLIIGHQDQKVMYAEEVVRRGGVVEFFPSTMDHVNIRLLHGPIGRADVVIYVSTYTSHIVDKYIKKVAPEKLVYFTCKGRDSFVRELEAYTSRLQSSPRTSHT